MHIPGHRVSPQVSLLTVRPGTVYWCPRRTVTRRLTQAVIKAHSVADPLTLFSPSKINLFLRIIRKRPDGYHDLASLFHVIDLGDTMTFSPIPRHADTLSCNMPGVPLDDSNLVIKALNLFRRHTGLQQFFQVHLEKKVPHGGGLGGGSANAATTLWAANELAGHPASNDQLLQWSGEIGSDVSVFFSKGAAYCTGRGEIVEDVPPPLPLGTPLLLVKPPMGLATPDIFKALDLSQCSKADPRQLLQQMTEAGTMTQHMCVNDLERPAFERLAELQELKTSLQTRSDDRFTAVFMTGSGSTMVGVGSSVAPVWMQERIHYQDVFCSPAKLIARKPEEWYQPSKAAD
ncbi:hypothetical protein ABBQ32_009600 [Trebouxia sp. C0010 RCD-2024]